ncbi:MAG: DUF1905 domain-containing protein [Chloroflexi bacterium]|nr:MAG: DUF1905 domain-containing protein [Chloroflexota bacterium]
MTDSIRFSAVIERPWRDPTGGGAMVQVPQEAISVLGGLKQMRVTGTLNGLDFRSSTMPGGDGRLYLGVHKATRAAAGVSYGDSVALEITRDDAPRVLDLPAELEEAFRAEPALRARFESLSFSRRRDLAGPISEAKKPETRAARLEKALAALRA